MHAMVTSFQYHPQTQKLKSVYSKQMVVSESATRKISIELSQHRFLSKDSNITTAYKRSLKADPLNACAFGF